MSNSDARVQEPATRTIVFKKDAAAAAVVELLDPQIDTSVPYEQRGLTVRFR